MTLTPQQRAQLREILVAGRRQVASALQTHQQQRSRVEHARDVLTDDADAATEHNADREVDLALTDRDVQRLAQIDAALARLDSPDYGLCPDCGDAIMFNRLTLEPQALRCVACESRRERSRGGVAHPSV